MAKNRIKFMDEMATRSRSIDYFNLSSWLPNPDPVLKKKGLDITAYKALLVDAHVWSCLISREAGVLKKEWKLDFGDNAEREKFYNEIYQQIDIQDTIGSIIKASYYGYQPIEIMWGKEAGYYVPFMLKEKPPEWFVFDAENVLKMRSKSSPLSGEEIPANKFLCPRYKNTYQNPYGEATASRIFWPVTFKTAGQKFWTSFVEKYGMPHVVLKHGKGAKGEDIDDMIEMAEKMVMDAIAAIPEDASMELLEVNKSSSSDIYDRFTFAMNKEISKAIVGQTLTSDIGDTGSRAATQTHKDVKDEIVLADCKLVERTFNELNKIIDAVNFDSGHYPKFKLYEQTQIDKTRAERDKIVVDMGVKLSKEYFLNNYDYSEEDIIIEEKQPPIINQFAEIDPASVDQIKDDKMLDDAVNKMKFQTQIEPIIAPIIDMIENGQSYDEIKKNIIEVYPSMDSNKFENMFTRATFISQNWSRANG